MEYNIAFLITTYNRQDSVTRLFERLKPLGDVYIVNDGGIEINLECKVLNRPHLGREGFFKTVSNLWEMVRRMEYDYYFMMPDDLMPIDGFIESALSTWDKLPSDRICLNLFVDKLRYKKNCWTNCPIIETEDYLKTGWVDGCFMARKNFFEFFGYSVPQPFRDWSDKTLGSGVGAVISRALFAQRKGMYQVKHSLFLPMEEAYNSRMNPYRTDDINEII